MNFLKESDGIDSFRSSVISNDFSYRFHLKDFLEILTYAQNMLSGTNQQLEEKFAKSCFPTLTLTADQFLTKVWYKSTRLVNKVLLYSIYGNQPYPLRAGTNKRSELIGHINFMTVGLCQKLKENHFDDSLYYSTEEDLFDGLLKIFHPKLFESPIFRKVGVWMRGRYVVKYGK